jgi:N-acetylneuraminate synthase/pseudaminic acid synthase
MNFKIGSIPIGSKCNTFIVAEMSGNHNGDFNNAIKIIHAARRAGVDAIKLQTYTPDTITLKSNAKDFLILSDSPWSNHNSLWDLYNKAYTPWEWHEELFAEARKIGLEIFSSPFDEKAVDFLESLNAPAYKIASPEITHIPLLEKVAQTNKPIILSTGVAEIIDIELALDTLRTAGAKDIILLKCTSAYPTPVEEVNLITILDMAKRFNVLVGLSDHTITSVVGIASVALGSCMIEKHFKLNDDIETVDSFFSLNESQFSLLVSDIRLVEKSLGEVNYDIAPSAKKSLSGRRSIYVSAQIKKGEFLTDKNIGVFRPSYGMHPKYKSEIMGRQANKSLFPGDRLTFDDLK